MSYGSFRLASATITNMAMMNDALSSMLRNTVVMRRGTVETDRVV